jgi:hypothetical protein
MWNRQGNGAVSRGWINETVGRSTPVRTVRGTQLLSVNLGTALAAIIYLPTGAYRELQADFRLTGATDLKPQWLRLRTQITTGLRTSVILIVALGRTVHGQTQSSYQVHRDKG